MGSRGEEEADPIVGARSETEFHGGDQHSIHIAAGENEAEAKAATILRIEGKIDSLLESTKLVIQQLTLRNSGRTDPRPASPIPIPQEKAADHGQSSMYRSTSDLMAEEEVEVVHVSNYEQVDPHIWQGGFDSKSQHLPYTLVGEESQLSVLEEEEEMTLQTRADNRYHHNLRSKDSIPKLKRRRSKVQCRTVAKNYWRQHIIESLEDKINFEEMQDEDGEFDATEGNIDEDEDCSVFVEYGKLGNSSSKFDEAVVADHGVKIKTHAAEGVAKSVGNVNTISEPALVSKDPTEQAMIDNFIVQELDGTQNEWGWCNQKLGANAILAIPLAVCKAGNKLVMQEFMILLVGTSSFKEAMRMGAAVAKSGEPQSLRPPPEPPPKTPEPPQQLSTRPNNNTIKQTKAALFRKREKIRRNIPSSRWWAQSKHNHRQSQIWKKQATLMKKTPLTVEGSRNLRESSHLQSHGHEVTMEKETRVRSKILSHDLGSRSKSKEDGVDRLILASPSPCRLATAMAADACDGP